MSTYVIRGGRDGDARLKTLARVMRPGTGRLLDEVGVKSGWRCLDVGCGGGQVTLELSRRVGPSGEVVGLDSDGTILGLVHAYAEAAGAANVRCVQGDALTLWPDESFDLTYARFLLSHVPNPKAVLDGMALATRQGGVVVAEDVEFAGHLCYPRSAPFDRYVELYREVVRRRGGDAEIGPRLASLFHEVGVEDVRVQIVQPAALSGDVKEMAPITMKLIGDSVVAEGLASEDEVASLVADLTEQAYNPTALTTLPRVFQVWGIKA